MQQLKKICTLQEVTKQSQCPGRLGYLHLNRPGPPGQSTRSLLHPRASPFSPPQTDALQQLQKDSEAIRSQYAHYFDLSLVNNSVEETLKTLQEAFDQACRSPQWVPVSWVY